MTWQYSGAVIHSNKQNPQPGDYVITTLIDPTQLDANDEPIAIAHVWTYDGTQTKAQFVAMVRQEVKAHRDHLNTIPPANDVTDEFTPD